MSGLFLSHLYCLFHSRPPTQQDQHCLPLSLQPGSPSSSVGGRGGEGRVKRIKAEKGGGKREKVSAVVKGEGRRVGNGRCIYTH